MQARDMIKSAGGEKESLEMFYCFLERRQKLESLIQLQRFLNDMKESSTSAMDHYLEHNSKDYIRDLEGYWSTMKEVCAIEMPTVLVLGKCGAGKSTLCNIIAGLPEDSGDGAEGFKTSSETLACTQQTTIEDCCFFGDASKPLKIIDTPGFDDPTKNHDAVIISNLVDVLKKEVNNVNLILLTLNGQCPRLDGSLLAMLKIIRGMFTPNIWDNMAVVFTRMPMNIASVDRRCKKDSNHDANVANGFINAIREQFNPPETGKSLQYVYMDACYNDQVAEEKSAMEECKRNIWGMIVGNEAFDTNHVEKVLSEYASLKEEVQRKESELSELGRQVREFEQKEFERIRRENEETRTPVNGLTFLRLKNQSFHEDSISDYSDFIDKLYQKTGKHLKSFESFYEILKQIEEEGNTEIGFIKDNADELCTENLLNRIPRREKKDKVSQMVLALEINNYTKHFLADLDIHMVEGNENPLFVWDMETDSEMAKPTVLLKPYHSFFIAPYAKERLIFRNSGQHNKNKLIGIITMNIRGITHDSPPERKMIIHFEIDARKYLSGNTKFLVSLSNDISKSASDINQHLKKKKPKMEFEQISFTKKDTKRTHNPCQTLMFPSDPFYLNSCFGNACLSRSMVILSKTRQTQETSD